MGYERKEGIYKRKQQGCFLWQFAIYPDGNSVDPLYTDIRYND